MNNVYEYFRDVQTTLYFKFNDNPTYPAHFHAGIEVFILKKGFFSVTVNGESVNLTAGTVVVFDSYDVHSYDFKSRLEETSAVILIPNEFRRYLLPSEKHRIERHLITDGAFASRLYSLAEEFLLNKPKTIQDGALILICTLLKDRLSFTSNAETDETNLLRRILTFISENYTGDVSRSTIAKTLGYTESYVSHVFHRYLDISLSEFTNRLRLKHVKDAINNGNNQPISTLLYQAGFKSEQTYYRTKAKYKGNITPIF